jgi:oligopeptide transport system substrate-binding protein
MNGRFILCFFPVLVSLLSGCGRGDRRTAGETQLRQAPGGVYYGGVFRLNESEYIKNLFPHNITDAYSYRVASQIYEGLFRFNDETLDVEPGLAERFELDETRTLYTFYLKRGVYFHDNPCFPDGKGRELTAEDVRYAFTRLCTQDINNQHFSIFKGLLVGADAHYAASAEQQPEAGVEGIRVVDSHTLQLQITAPNALFLVHLARPACFIFPREAFERYGVDMRIQAVGTGPFMLQPGDVDEDISILLRRNSNYYRKDAQGNALPYLDAVNIQFIKDKKTELFEFRKGNLDMIYRLPTEFIIEILEETMPGASGEYSQFELQRSPEMMTQILVLNNQTGVFSDLRVRKAFSYAIDRAKILDFVLNGEGYAPGHHGITPPVFSNYDINGIRGYQLNIDSARYYLGQAGYPGGKNFPSIQFMLNAEGERQTHVAVEIQKQLKDHLNIDVELVILPFAQLLEKSYRGEFTMMRAAWVADFPSPENFLWVFNGSDVPNSAGKVSYPNIPRYINQDFDRLFDAALGAPSIDAANALFSQAESLLMQEAPVIVLWYDEGYRLVQSYVRNFPNNPMQYRDFAEVYFQDALKL